MNFIFFRLLSFRFAALKYFLTLKYFLIGASGCLLISSSFAVTQPQSSSVLATPTPSTRSASPIPSATSTPSNVEKAFSPPTITELAPTKNHYQVQENIAKLLQQEHYRQIKFDDHLSEEILNSYLTYLDGQKSFFLQSDIAELQIYRHSFDNDLLENHLEAGFAIFNLYQQRARQKFIYSLQLLDQGMAAFDFNQSDTLLLDRKKEPWPENLEAAQKLWANQLKAALLNLKLTEKKPAASLDVLRKRYQSQLLRLSQNTSDDAFQTYMNSITQVFDPHTEYLSPRTSENFNINMKLSLEGIGAVLQSEDTYTKIVRLVPAGPAEKSQLLHPADRIISVGQGEKGEMIDIIGWRIDEVVDLIRGPKGSKVRLEIIPFDAENDQTTQFVNITRDQVILEEQAAQSKILPIRNNNKDYKIGVITVPAFYLDFKGFRNNEPNYRSTTRDVALILENFQKQKIDGLVIDLRNNGGGSLQEANTLLGLFITSGPTVQTRNFKGSVDIYEDTDERIFYKGPMTVMVNRLSASASEIFAGAIQDYQRGLVVGSQTFGKGTVQSLEKLSQGQLKITQAKFYRISGGSNQNLGILPDIEYPDLYDKNIIGESSLEYALPWDTIQSVDYQAYMQLKPLIGKLTTEHQQRIKQDVDFQYLLQQLQLNQSIEQETQMSLNEASRIKQRDERNQQRLAIENTHRKSKNLPPLSSLPAEREEELTLTNSPDKNAKKDNEDDPLLKETASILSDFIELNSKKDAKQIAQIQ